MKHISPADGMLRPKAAAARFKVARQTLGTWADRGLIGRSRVGRITLYVAADIADLIAGGLTGRRVVPMAPPVAASDDDAWKSSLMWKGHLP